jgi:salicylate hydroxylase
MAPNCRIAIVGGGLAGLATAQALKSFSIKAEVFEAAPALGEIGAAVNTSPQAVKALRAIGVGDRIAAVGHLSPGIYTRNMLTGEFLELNDRVKLAERFGAPYYSFHRADLLNALANGLEPNAIHLAHRLTGIEEREERITLNFANGTRFEAEYVIGADGVRSALRRALYGADNPTYTGQMVWRSLLNAGDIPQETIDPTGRAGQHLLAYEIRQGKLVNIVTQQDTDEWVEEGWSTRGDPDEMRASFPNSEPRLEKLLSIVTECSKWGLFTRPLTQNWGRGRVQLIGDAAHAMLPNAGQGACQAFEDALHPRPLARCLRRSVGSFCQFSPRAHPACTRRAAALVLQLPVQAHAGRDGAEAFDRRRHRQRPWQLGMGLGLRSGQRMGQGAFRSRRLRGMSNAIVIEVVEREGARLSHG